MAKIFLKNSGELLVLNLEYANLNRGNKSKESDGIEFSEENRSIRSKVPDSPPPTKENEIEKLAKELLEFDLNSNGVGP